MFSLSFFVVRIDAKTVFQEYFLPKKFFKIIDLTGIEMFCDTVFLLWEKIITLFHLSKE
jgi:hypothetical protein